MHSSTSIIYAGGTFGSHGTPLSPLPVDEFLPALEQHLKAQNFNTQFIKNTIIKDSSTLTPYDFVSFYQLILNHHHKGARHFVVITGTDTLSYLAAFLSVACADLAISLVVTGSMLPFFQPNTQPLNLDDDSDAWDNLQLALSFLSSTPPCGVFVSFDGNIFHGLSTQKIHASDVHAFCGIAISTADPATTKYSHPKANDDIAQLLDKARTTHIHTFYATPSSADIIAHQLSHLLHEPPSALILIGYGAGNLPTSDQLVQLLAQLIDKGFLIVMTKAPPFGAVSQAYKAGAWQYDIGIISGGAMPISEIYARCLWICLHNVPNKSAAWHALADAL